MECPGGREERDTFSLVTKGKELILVNVYSGLYILGWEDGDFSK